MFIVELVVQGVRGIRELARIRFQSGFNFVAAGNESGKTSSVDSALRLLFPRNDQQAIDPLISKYTPDASRAALVASADDGAYYRVIEDFAKRMVNLSKYNAPKKEFVLMHKDWESTAQFMSGMTGGISEEEYNRLYVFRREQYSAKQGRVSPPASAPRPVPARPAARPKASNAAAEAQLAALKESLHKAESAADADYKAQASKLKMDEIRKKLDGMADINNRFADIEASIADLKGCNTLPEKISELIEEHEHRQGEKMGRSDELQKDIMSLQSQIDAVPRVNVFKDPLSMVGAAVSAVSIFVAMFLPTTEAARYFPIGVLIGVGLFAVVWYRGSQKGNERKLLGQEIEGLQEQLAELEKSFEQGGAEIMACMKATGSTTAAELKEKSENYRYFVSLREDIDEQRQRMLDGRTIEDLQADLEKQRLEVVELEKAAAAVAQYNTDTYAVRQEIDRLEQELSGGATTDFSSAQDVLDDFTFSAPPAVSQGEAGPVGFLDDINIAGRIGGIEMETLVPAVEAAAQRNLSAITGGRYVRIEAGQEGDPVVHAKDDSVLPFSALSHATRDLVYFCLRTGLVEAVAGKRRLPFLLDDPLAGLDPARQQAACQILRSLGSKTQVILFTSNPALKAAGDVAAELK